MNLLILGGTQFIGRYLTELALESGHQVTLFNRNRGAPGLFPQVETLTGDRQGDLSALEGRTWDAVIDTSAYTPATVRRSAELLRGAVQHYTFISSVSAYQNFAQLGMDETAQLSTMTDEEVTAAETTERSETGVEGAAYGPKYGPLKVRCEHIVQSLFEARSLIVRPGLVIGPHDYSDRFTYWVKRIGVANRGWEREVLAPGKPERSVQFIDARDLAAWTLRKTVDKLSGTFHATGPDYELTFGAFLDICREVLNPNAELVWVEDDFLLERGVEAADLMPWLPVGAMPGWEGFFSLDNSRAIRAGLTFQPLEETIRDTFAWDRTRYEGEPLKAGLTQEREAALLNRWRKVR